MGKMNSQSKQILEAFKELLYSIMREDVEVLDMIISTSKEGITSYTIIVKEKNG